MTRSRAKLAAAQARIADLEVGWDAQERTIAKLKNDLRDTRAKLAAAEARIDTARALLNRPMSVTE
jgi:uncharacterized coiled-coil protein SlyX